MWSTSVFALRRRWRRSRRMRCPTLRATEGLALLPEYHKIFKKISPLFASVSSLSHLRPRPFLSQISSPLPSHSRFFTKLRSKKYTQGKLFSEFSKTFLVPNPRFLSFSKLFSVQMQTASYLFTVKKHEKRTTCTTRNSKRPPSFGHISHAKKELKKIFKIFEKISKKGLTF